MQLSHKLFCLGLSFVVFIAGTSFLSTPFYFYEAMRLSEVIYIFSPLVISLFMFLVFVEAKQPSLGQLLIFIGGLGLFCSGFGMHLGANALNNLRPTEMAVAELTYFFDEILSHWLTHLGLDIMIISVLYQHWKASKEFVRRWVILGGFLFGFQFFINTVEGQMTLLDVPFAVVLTAVIFFKLRSSSMKLQAVSLFFLVAMGISSLMFLAWGIYWGGLPELSEVGLI